MCKNLLCGPWEHIFHYIPVLKFPIFDFETFQVHNQNQCEKKVADRTFVYKSAVEWKKQKQDLESHLCTFTIVSLLN